MSQISVIDFSGVKEGTPQWESVKSQVRKALQEHGFFEAKFGQNSFDLQKSAFEQVRQVFDLPLQIKMRNNINKAGRGYIGQIPSHPLYESLAIDDPLANGSVECFTNLLWPQGNPDFR